MCVSPNRQSQSPYAGLPPSQIIYQGKTQNIEHQMHQQRIQRQMQQLYLDTQFKVDPQKSSLQTQQGANTYFVSNQKLNDPAADIFGNMVSDPALHAWYPIVKSPKYACSPQSILPAVNNQLSSTVRLTDRHRRSVVDPNSSLQTSTGTTPTLKSNTMGYTRATSTTDGNIDVQQIPMNSPYMAVIYPPGRCINNALGSISSQGPAFTAAPTYQPAKTEYLLNPQTLNPSNLRLDGTNRVDYKYFVPPAENVTSGKTISRKRANQQTHFCYSQLPQKRVHLCHPLTNRVSPSRLKQLHQRHQYQIRVPQLQQQIQQQHCRMQPIQSVRYLSSRNRESLFPSSLSSQSGLSISPLSPSYVKQVRSYVDDLEFKENREERDMLRKEIVDLHYRQFVDPKK